MPYASNHLHSRPHLNINSQEPIDSGNRSLSFMRQTKQREIKDIEGNRAHSRKRTFLNCIINLKRNKFYINEAKYNIADK